MLKRTLAAAMVACSVGGLFASGAQATASRVPTVDNIICNDGTVSPTCQDCHRGCCSYHGGCR